MENAPAERAGLPPASHTPDLRAAIRRARLEEAERSTVVTELRSSEVARLELLGSQLQPLLAQAPDGLDLFDVGLVRGDRPRYFVDMVAFVEMGRDRKTYQFVRDFRDGRKVIAESTDSGIIVDAIASYMARRIVEREKALIAAADGERPAAALAAPVTSAATVTAGAETTFGEFAFTFVIGVLSGAAILYALFKLGMLN